MVRLGFALFLIIATVRVGLVLAGAVETPFYDTWDVVIGDIAQPLLAHTFDPSVLWKTYNGHVILPSLLLDLGMLTANDVQFDNVTICILDQLLRAAWVAALIVTALPIFSAQRRRFLFAATIFACVPYDVENVGMDIANSYGFLAIFSVVAIALTASARSSIAWFGACVAATLATLSMGSGFFADVVLLAIIALRWQTRTLPSTTAFCASLCSFALVSLGVMFGRHLVGSTQALGSIQLAQLFLVVLLWLPTFVFAHSVRRNGMRDATDLAVLGVSMWGALQLAAMVIARPEFRVWLPISRYMDIIGVAAFANLGCFVRFANRAPKYRVFAEWAVTACVVAVIAAAPYAASWLDWRADQLHAQAQRIERYVHERDIQSIADAPIDELAYPSRDVLRRYLDKPDVRQILGDRYGTRPHPAWLTRIRRALGVAAFPLGIIALLLAVWLLRVTPRAQRGEQHA